MPELTHTVLYAGLIERDDHLALLHQLGVERLVQIEHRLQAAVVLGGELRPFGTRAALEDLHDLLMRV